MRPAHARGLQRPDPGPRVRRSRDARVRGPRGRLRLHDRAPQPRDGAGRCSRRSRRRARGATRTSSTTSSAGASFAVRESHEPEVVAAHGEWVNDLVTIDLATGEVEVIASGRRLLRRAPARRRTAGRLVWLEWRHPNLPWDGTELKLAAVGQGGEVGPATTVAGSRSDWISQPRWSPAGVLHFVAEPDGWMNLFRYQGGVVEPIAPMAVEFALAGLGLRQRRVRVPARRRDPGRRSERRPRSALPDRARRVVDDRWTCRTRRCCRSRSTATRRSCARSRRSSPRSSRSSRSSSGEVAVLRRATPFVADRADVSGRAPRRVSDDRRPDRPRQLLRAAQPRGSARPMGSSRRSSSPRTAARPPPRSAAGRPSVQLFTSRGYAVLDVDYGGSTGYGRDYRKAPRGRVGDRGRR